MNDVLVVDLDGTLLKSDMLHETFWNALGRNWHVSFKSILALAKGKAVLKKYLADEADIEVSSLPFDQKVIDYVKTHVAKGGCAALVTASNQHYADEISNHLGIFDEAHGSDGKTNLIGAAKAAFLVNRFGKENFDYMGDAPSDLAVWGVSRRIITVNVSRSLSQQVENLGKPYVHLNTVTRHTHQYSKALRPHQWLKNILIFIPMLAAHEFDAATLTESLLALIAFSLIASCVYILNDLFDLKSDRVHPRKQFRPFASGSVPISHGSILTLILFVFGVLVSTLVGWEFLVSINLYFFITIAYSLKLKRQIAMDICILATLYTMRIFAGSVATGIEISPWLLAFAMFFFLSLAALKRQAELVDMSKREVTAAVGRGYLLNDLPILTMVGLVAGYISVLIMALYINSPMVVKLYSTPEILWGICCVLIYWLTRVHILTHRGLMHDDPLIFATHDRTSKICLMAMLVLVLVSATQ